LRKMALGSCPREARWVDTDLIHTTKVDNLLEERAGEECRLGHRRT
jgi:hypothetical protein